MQTFANHYGGRGGKKIEIWHKNGWRYSYEMFYLDQMFSIISYRILIMIYFAEGTPDAASYI